MIHLANLETSNTKLAAALTAVGIPLNKDKPIQIITGGRGANRIGFFFQPISPCGLYHTRELMLAWDDADWHIRNPEHPFAYLKVAFDNMERLTDYCRQGTPVGFVTKGSKIAFLSLSASDELQKKVFKELKR